MIRVTKLNGEVFYVNAYEIEFIEETPDTVISLKSGKKVLVAEKADAVINSMIQFYRATAPLHRVAGPDGETGMPDEPPDGYDTEYGETDGENDSQ